MILTEKQELLLNKLNKIPPDLEEIAGLITDEKYSSDDISLVGAVYIDGCSGEDIETEPNHFIRIEPNAPYIFDVMKLLVKNGLDPNAIYENMNIMEALQFIGTPYVAADTLALLLEHGGKTDLVIDGERLFDDIDFDVIFGAFNQEDRSCYDSLVHIWFVMLGYGARQHDGNIPVDVFEIFDEDYIHRTLFDLSKLKNHRDYTFGISNVPGRGESWSLHIFDKKTFYEVARL